MLVLIFLVGDGAEETQMNGLIDILVTYVRFLRVLGGVKSFSLSATRHHIYVVMLSHE